MAFGLYNVVSNVIAYNVTSLLYTFVVALFLTTLLFKWYRERNYPPGPIGVPVLGYVLFLGSKPNEKLRDLGRKYGDVFRLVMYVIRYQYFFLKLK